jgi:hypothetical protein
MDLEFKDNCEKTTYFLNNPVIRKMINEGKDLEIKGVCTSYIVVQTLDYKQIYLGQSIYFSDKEYYLFYMTDKTYDWIMENYIKSLLRREKLKQLGI